MSTSQRGYVEHRTKLGNSHCAMRLASVGRNVDALSLLFFLLDLSTVGGLLKGSDGGTRGAGDGFGLEVARLTAIGLLVMEDRSVAAWKSSARCIGERCLHPVYHFLSKRVCCCGMMMMGAGSLSGVYVTSKVPPQLSEQDEVKH